MGVKREKKQDYYYMLAAVCLFLFCILKVLRGADENSTQQGGIWNIISLAYYPLFLLGVSKIRQVEFRWVFAAPSLYIALSVSFALITSKISLSVSSIYSFLMIAYSFLVYFVFYMYSGEDERGDKLILAGYIGCLAVTFYTTTKHLFLGGERLMASDVYYSLCLFPFVLIFVKNKKLKYLFIVLQFFASFFADKRTGFIAFVIGIVLYFFTEQIINGKFNAEYLIRAVFLIVVFFTVFYFASTYLDTKYDLGIYGRFEEIEEDGGSGRAYLYGRILDEFESTGFLEKLTGHGHATAGKLGGHGRAHNDFLEILYNYGILAAICVVVFYFSLINEAIKMTKRKSPYASAFWVSVVTGILLSMFSYFIAFYTYVTCSMAFWGYVLKMEKLRLEKVKSNEYS